MSLNYSDKPKDVAVTAIRVHSSLVLKILRRSSAAGTCRSERGSRQSLRYFSTYNSLRVCPAFLTIWLTSCFLFKGKQLVITLEYLVLTVKSRNLYGKPSPQQVQVLGLQIYFLGLNNNTFINFLLKYNTQRIKVQDLNTCINQLNSTE